MMKISLDTNAVLDFCYRTYPENVFPQLWGVLHSFKLANTVKFFICDSILSEIEQKISDYNYDEDIFQNFLDRFSVRKITSDEHGASTLELKKQLLRFPASSDSHHVKKDNYADLDVISLSHHLGSGACVLTCEQKAPVFNWDAKSHKGSLKVPNICEKFSLDCGNWPQVLLKLGVVV